ncbi:MAG: very short patch repair endonuclease [Lysobacteraceae bacterium]
MSDPLTPAERSRHMSRIRSANTRPEMMLRKSLWRAGFRFRLADKRLPGRPDIVLPRWKTAVFVHGCFWHAHADCRYFRVPGTRSHFWAEKFEANVRRDRKVLAECRELGWRTVIVWECAVRANVELAAYMAGQAAKGECPPAALEVRESPSDRGLVVLDVSLA